MRHWLILMAFFSVVKCFSQRDTNRYANVIKVSYGNFYPLKNQFRNPLENLNSNLSNPLRFVSLVREHQRFNEVGFTYYLNQVSYNTENIKTNWFALNFTYMLKRELTPKTKHINIFIGIGGILGEQFVLVKKKKTEVFRNFNASLLPQLEIRIKPTKRVGIGITSNFLYDITKSKWRSFDSKQYIINYTKFSGAMVSLNLIWSYAKY